jgi:hypothetical protein
MSYLLTSPADLVKGGKGNPAAAAAVLLLPSSAAVQPARCQLLLLLQMGGNWGEWWVGFLSVQLQTPA